jgi:hypothetical protein
MRRKAVVCRWLNNWPQYRLRRREIAVTGFQALLSAPPPLFGFFRPAVLLPVLSPCPFRVRPFWARCVGVGVFSFFLSSFAFPVSCPGWVRCHFMFTVISFSRPCHLPCCGRVCVHHLYGCKISYYCRGVWHSCPGTRNEAVEMSGKGNVAGFLYVQIYLYNV